MGSVVDRRACFPGQGIDDGRGMLTVRLCACAKACRASRSWPLAVSFFRKLIFKVANNEGGRSFRAS